MSLFQRRAKWVGGAAVCTARYMAKMAFESLWVIPLFIAYSAVEVIHDIRERIIDRNGEFPRNEKGKPV